ncbi:unnamed protein product [Danaus chrysippus]|uniref:(African queen) hypothetical protein n=1 Tax=Danaus chrysippus TaxID=151541 RepID=A0A8J2QGM8_9NEOP|nr:unnamed protein product [Danaus chrysippus]
MEIEQGIRQRRTGGKLRTDGKEVDDRSNKGIKQRFEELLAPSTHFTEFNEVFLLGKITWSFNYRYKVPDDLLKKVQDA